MLSSVNLFKPATGDAITVPTQDIVLGCFFMTKMIDKAVGQGKIFSSSKEARMAYEMEIIDLRAKIKVLINNSVIETSAGRLFLNAILPKEMKFINKEMDKKALRVLTEEIIEKVGPENAEKYIDRIKKIGFDYATKSGISWGMNDLHIPKEKGEIISRSQKQVDIIRKQYQEGLLTREERRAKSIEVWSKAGDEIAKLVPFVLDPNGPVDAMFSSGARGTWGQANQLVGMKGLVVNPASEVIELPIISSFKEGFNVLEYFISTHGGRKGLADTALKTAQAGYLTRRLVDVAQDVIIREKNCKDKNGIVIYKQDLEDLGISLGSRVFGRTSLEEVVDKKKVIIKKGDLINKKQANQIDEMEISKLRVRSPVSCKTMFGLCQQCYGLDLGRNKLVNLGEAVGIVTAQAIGEPATQLTLRTFHIGGVAGGDDITQGLPRVEEIFEARIPKGKASMSEINGNVVNIENNKGQKIITIEGWQEPIKKGDQRKKVSKEYIVASRVGVWVKKNDSVVKGQQLCEGPIELKELFKLAGQEAVQRYVLKGVQKVYSTQGGGLNDKHIEVIIRQMFSRIKVNDSGETNLLEGAIVEKDIFRQTNEKAKKDGKKPCIGEPMILGITKVALSTESFLSSASFQETVRILIESAVQGKIDPLRGLKENVILGKLIPVGTGFDQE